MSKNILITGGSGYIGSTLVPTLIKNNYNVTVLDNFIFKQDSLLSCCKYKNFSVVEGDCRDKNLLKKLIKKVDIVIPLAAYVGAPICDENKTSSKLVNYKSIKMLCSILSDHHQLIFPSTNSAYGNGVKGGQHCTEESLLNPISIYGKTKVEAEKVVLERENSITFRLATVFGVSPRMRIDLLVNDFVYRAVYDKAVTIFEGHFKRNLVHIIDVSRVFLHSINNFKRMRGEAYNVGLDKANYSKLELCKIIKNLIPGFVYLEAPIGKDPDQRNYIVSNEKLKNTGFRAKKSLKDGIIELIKAYTMIKKTGFSNV
jgi:nucleoside-diphosphate-sugar epimerase